MKQVMRKATSLAMTMLLFTSICNINTYAARSVEPKITKKFVAESEYSVTRDSNGATVITLTNVQPLPAIDSRSGENHFTQTTLAILPTDEEQANNIIINIESLRGSGGKTEDDWFYGSSVYLKSTVNYTTAVGSDKLTYGRITNVTISASTNSGSTISSMLLRMGQNGWSTGGYKTQSTTFDATKTRSFTAPSSWVSVLWNGSGDVGANIQCTAVRQGGQSTFYLYNNVQ